MQLWALAISAASGILLVLLLVPVTVSLRRANRYAEIMSSADRFFASLQLVRTYVLAAEQIYGKGRGTEKLEFVKQALAREGIVSGSGGDHDRVRAMIEAAVRELKYFEQD